MWAWSTLNLFYTWWALQFVFVFQLSTSFNDQPTDGD